MFCAVPYCSCVHPDGPAQLGCVFWPRGRPVSPRVLLLWFPRRSLFCWDGLGKPGLLFRPGALHSLASDRLLCRPLAGRGRFYGVPAREATGCPSVRRADGSCPGGGTGRGCQRVRFGLRLQGAFLGDWNGSFPFGACSGGAGWFDLAGISGLSVELGIVFLFRKTICQKRSLSVEGALFSIPRSIYFNRTGRSTSYPIPSG